MVSSPSSSKQPKLDLLVAVATYNEIENLPNLVEQILVALPECHILVVDDNSPDGTGQWIEDRASADDRINSIIRAGKLGLGTAVIEKFRYAQDHDYAWLLTMDADHSHSPQEMSRLLAARDGADVIIGSRYVTGGAIKNWPWHRRLASRMANAFARLTLGTPVADCSGGFRCYRVAKLAELNYDEFVSEGYSFYEEVLWRLHRLHARFVEVPITFTDREAGKSKAGLPQVVAAITKLISLRWRS